MHCSWARPSVAQQCHCRPRLLQRTHLSAQLCLHLSQFPVPLDHTSSPPSSARKLSGWGTTSLSIPAFPGAVEESSDEEMELAHSEIRQGLELWRSMENVISLQTNIRAPGILSRLQHEMRQGHISDDWPLESYQHPVTSPTPANRIFPLIK